MREQPASATTFLIWVGKVCNMLYNKREDYLKALSDIERYKIQKVFRRLYE